MLYRTLKPQTKFRFTKYFQLHCILTYRRLRGSHSVGRVRIYGFGNLHWTRKNSHYDQMVHWRDQKLTVFGGDSQVHSGCSRFLPAFHHRGNTWAESSRKSARSISCGAVGDAVGGDGRTEHCSDVAKIHFQPWCGHTREEILDTSDRALAGQGASSTSQGWSHERPSERPLVDFGGTSCWPNQESSLRLTSTEAAAWTAAAVECRLSAADDRCLKLPEDPESWGKSKSRSTQATMEKFVELQIVCMQLNFEKWDVDEKLHQNKNLIMPNSTITKLEYFILWAAGVIVVCFILLSGRSIILYFLGF